MGWTVFAFNWKHQQWFEVIFWVSDSPNVRNRGSSILRVEFLSKFERMDALYKHLVVLEKVYVNILYP